MELRGAVRKFWKDLGPRTQLFGLLKTLIVPSAVAVIDGLLRLIGEPVSIPTWAYGVLLFISAVCVLIYFLFERIREFETRAEVNLELSDPIQTMSPGDQGRRSKRFSLKVSNTSDRRIDSVQLKMIEFINVNGKPTNFPNTRFSVVDMEGMGATTIEAHDSEMFHIAMADENSDGVVMLYAGQPQAISAQFFPHKLTVRLTAHGLCQPVDRNFDLRLEGRVLFMEKGLWASGNI